MDSASPFAGILAGQPTLNRQLRMGMFAALDQRIATRFAIKPMDLAESAAYLRHHLKLAGREEPLLADNAVARLHRVANGLPRALNNAATAALIAAAAAGEDLVDDACAKKAVAELTRDSPHPGRPPGRPRSPAGQCRAIAVTPAEALRWWRAGYRARQAAEHETQAQQDRLIASYRAQRAASQQAELDALLLETIAALAGLFSRPDHPGNHPALPPPQQKITVKTCRNAHTKRCRLVRKQRGR